MEMVKYIIVYEKDKLQDVKSKIKIRLLKNYFHTGIMVLILNLIGRLMESLIQIQTLLVVYHQ